jgi:RHH-type proline utilization regulon transcriptional repressor/proline dehydrogenase/delta 1-pyrroline-5-carboxylate dehydrogenase
MAPALRRSFQARASIEQEKDQAALQRAIANPARRDDVVGAWRIATAQQMETAFQRTAAAQPAWNARGGPERAAILRRLGDALEEQRATLIALLVREAGKTIVDAVSEVREAVDSCRYYAELASTQFGAPNVLPGPTGESNELTLHGRGVFVCISPWNFPLAIFLGQITAALAAGNCVIAKPAQQTPLIGALAVQLAHQAGIPSDVLVYLPGDGELGAALVQHPATGGVAFTGSTATAGHINGALAARAGPIVPLIAETGGQNVLFADSTALLEQLTDDVVRSAFGSAGQRCSALRLLLIQDDVADRALAMIAGAMRELCIGNPAKFETDIGPLIESDAVKALTAHIDRLRSAGCGIETMPLPDGCTNGSFMAPHLVELDDLTLLTEEHFGPVLHVLRYQADQLDAMIDAVRGLGFGLTMGIHSRIDARARHIFARSAIGNTYVNRNMIGAVVGVQPFGGQGLSGTGPKAGGPHYLLRFAVERTLTINTMARGGNIDLLRSG